MPVYVTTTGTLSPVVIESLGNFELVHPTTDLDLELSFERDILFGNSDLQAAVDAGYITLSKSTGSGDPILTIDKPEAAETNSFADIQSINITADTNLDLDWASFLIVTQSNANHDLIFPDPTTISRRLFYFFHSGPQSNRKIFFKEFGNNTKLFTLRRGQLALAFSDGAQWIFARLVGGIKTDDDDDD